MTATADKTVYDLRGDLIEACSCMALCPCCLADDPHGGSCDNFTGYYIWQGVARGVDLSNLALVSLVHMPGNIFNGNWREVLFVDDKASDEQFSALVDAFRGRLGGPLADLAALTSDWVATYRVPISYTVTGGVGGIQVGHPSGRGYAIEAEMEPYAMPDGEPMTLHNSVVPGAAALVGKARHNQVAMPEHDMAWSFEGRNSTNGLSFHLTNSGS